MSGTDSYDADHELDVREIEGPPFDPILAALEAVGDGEMLLLVSSFEPEPLYDVLERRGFTYRTERVADDEYHVAVEHAG